MIPGSARGRLGVIVRAGVDADEGMGPLRSPSLGLISGLNLMPISWTLEVALAGRLDGRIMHVNE